MERPEFKEVISEILARWPAADRWSADLWEAYYTRLARFDVADAIQSTRHWGTEGFPPSAVQIESGILAHHRRVARQAALRAGADQW